MRTLVPLALAIVSLSACTVPVNEKTEPEIGTTSEALLRFDWSQGEPTLTMKPTANWICVLSEVRGHFEGDQEWVRVVARSGFWVLEGHSAQSGVGARATCFAKSQFQTASIGWSDPAQDKYAFWNSCPWGLACGGQSDDPPGSGCRTEHGLLWSGDSTAILNGIGGRFDGLDQFSEVRQSSDNGVTSDVVVRTCRDGREKGIRGIALAATSSPGTIARFINRSNVGVTSPDAVFTLTGNGTKMLARSDLAMCHLTHVSGSLRADGDRVTIDEIPDPDDATKLRQRLRVTSGGTVVAKAQCYAFDQRWFILPPIILPPFPLDAGT